MNTLQAFVLLLPALIAWAVGFALSRSAAAHRLADVPNARSLHAVPTPRVGGVGIMAGALPIMAWLGGEAVITLAVCALGLAIVSFIDDMRSLPIHVRLATHFAAAIACVLVAPWAGSGSIAIAALAVLAIVWSTNLYNFMDGADGLAGGMAVIGFSVMAAVSYPVFPGLSWAAAATASACLGFLALNFPPARVFMGDAGSVPLGFLAAAMGWLGITREVWPVWFPILVFSPFIADATVTLLRRLLRRERVWQAHRSHYYQRLVLSGMSVRRLALCEYAVMIVAGASAVLALRQGGFVAYAIIVVWAVTYAAIFLAIDRHASSNGAR